MLQIFEVYRFPLSRTHTIKLGPENRFISRYIRYIILYIGYIFNPRSRYRCGLLMFTICYFKFVKTARIQDSVDGKQGQSVRVKINITSAFFSQTFSKG